VCPGEERGYFAVICALKQSEEGIVEIIQNLIKFALEGNLTKELLRQDVGIVVGFVLNYPEVFSRFFLEETDAS